MFYELFSNNNNYDDNNNEAIGPIENTKKSVTGILSEIPPSWFYQN